jgi:tetratricopeptide (TPR) repeat protein
MAPEQHVGEVADARADQFSFCAALYEGLYGQRPFAGTTYDDLKENVLTAKLRPVPKDSGVPAWLGRIVARGLSLDPDERHASMDALVDALEHDPTTAIRQRRKVIAIGLALAVLGAGTFVGLMQMRSDDEGMCKAAPDAISSVWNDERSAAIERAFVATELPSARDTAARVARHLDAYRDEWVAARTDSCEDTHERGEQSEALMDLRMACLDYRLQQADALVSLLEDRPDVDVVSKAVDAVAGLGGLEDCADAEALNAVLPPPADPTAREQLSELRGRLATASALMAAGKYAEALEAARALEAEANDLGYAPLSAKVAYAVGVGADWTSDFHAAESALTRAIELAGAGRDDAVLAESWIRMLWVIGTQSDRPEEALRMMSFARAGETEQMRSDLETTIGAIALAQNDFVLARESYERAVSLTLSAHGEQHVAHAYAIQGLGELEFRAGEYARARELMQRALAIRMALLGTDHPAVADSLAGLSRVLAALGEFDGSLDFGRRALGVAERAFGVDHPRTVDAVVATASMVRERGRYAEARELYERAVASQRRLFPDQAVVDSDALIGFVDVLGALGDHELAAELKQDLVEERIRTLGADHPTVAAAQSLLALSYTALGRYEEAYAAHLRTQQLFEKIAPEALEHAGALLAVGQALHGLARFDEAVEYLGRGSALLEARLGSEHPYMAQSHTLHATSVLSAGDLVTAVRLLEHAMKIHTATPTEPAAIALTQFTLARALWKSGRNRARATELARAARDAGAPGGDWGPEQLAEAKAWLSQRGLD